jgi:hypothetical protein
MDEAIPGEGLVWAMYVGNFFCIFSLFFFSFFLSLLFFLQVLDSMDKAIPGEGLVWAMYVGNFFCIFSLCCCLFLNWLDYRAERLRLNSTDSVLPKPQTLNPKPESPHSLNLFLGFRV